MATSITQALNKYLSASWPAATLALTRFVFGLAMLISCIRFIALDWIADQYIDPKVHFPYYGFEWITPLPGTGMYFIYAFLTFSAVFVMLGLKSRLSLFIFTTVFTYVELIDKAYYLNHYYFVTVMGFLLCLLPTNAVWSLDSWLSPRKSRPYIPRWCADAVKLQISMVYIYAGLAKLNTDWMVHALPLKIWLPAHSDLPVIGGLLDEVWVAYAFSWFGALFDCTIPFFLMWRKTRIYAYVVVVIFHISTGILFQIGVFPVVMILMTLTFFDPPRWMSGDSLQQNTPSIMLRKVSRVSLVATATFLVIQLLFPWRYLLYPGNLFWTEEGYRFSWRVMLMEKAGTATFFVRDEGSKREGVVVNSDFLNVQQEKQMAMQPDMLLHFARYLRSYYMTKGMRNPIVRVESWVTLNSRPGRLLVDPTVNLGIQEDSFMPYPWVLRYEK